MKTFLEHYKQSLNEAEMLDISITALDKVPKKINELLDVPVVITEKTDGTKLSILRLDTPFDPIDFTKNWVVSYKNNILYPEDFAGVDDATHAEIKSKSIGVGQYKFIFDILKAAHPRTEAIPPGTELFAEFIMRKPTLTREYSRYHNIILLASSPVKYQIRAGRVYSTPERFDTEYREQYAKMLGIGVPRVLYRGTLSKLTSKSDPSDVLASLTSKFLSVESEFGGKMEGVVLEFENGQIYKLLQADQHDVTVRSAIKAKHEPADKATYWKRVREAAEDAVKQIKLGSELETNLSAISKIVYGASYSIADPNKYTINFKDDVYLTAKSIIVKKMPQNNGALFLGRMSPMTVAHHKIIENALHDYASVTVCLVKAKIDADNPFPIEVQLKMLRKCFGDRIELFTAATGNLSTILAKAKNNINVVLAGTDRVEAYKSQLKFNPDVKVEEIPRVDEVSGTLVRKFIRENDEGQFKRYTPECIWDMFEELKNHILKIKDI